MAYNIDKVKAIRAQGYLPVNGNSTATLYARHLNLGNSTYTDPTAEYGAWYEVAIRGGTATIGGSGYSGNGNIVRREWNGTAWANYEMIHKSGADIAYQPLNAKLTVISNLPSTGEYGINLLTYTSPYDIGDDFNEAGLIGGYSIGEAPTDAVNNPYYIPLWNTASQNFSWTPRTSARDILQTQGYEINSAVNFIASPYIRYANIGTGLIYTDPTNNDGVWYEVDIFSGNGRVGGVVYNKTGTIIRRAWNGSGWANTVYGNSANSLYLRDNGTASLPALAWENETGFGIYRKGTANLAITINSGDKLDLNASRLFLPIYTNSTSTGNGALVVGGGVGISDSLFVGSGIRQGGTSNIVNSRNSFNSFNAGNATLSAGWVSADFGGTGGVGDRIVIGSASQGPIIGAHNSVLSAWATLLLNGSTSAQAGNIYVPSTTASTSTSTGAMVISGGLGVGGTAWVNGLGVGNSAGANMQLDGALRTIQTDGSSPLFVRRAGNYAAICLMDAGGTVYNRWFCDANKKHAFSDNTGATVYAQINSSGDFVTNYGRVKAITVVTAATTLGATQEVVVFNSTGAITQPLPAASAHTGRVYTLKNKGAGTVTLDATSAGLIDGLNTATILQYSSLDIISDSNTWNII